MTVIARPDAPVTGLILSGGGARAAYQVGVLAAIADLLPDASHNPFPVIVGTSAGRSMPLAWPVARCSSAKPCGA